MAGIYFLFNFVCLTLMCVYNEYRMYTCFLFQLHRYDLSGAPKQEVFYFPLLPRLEQMYKDEEWRRALQYPKSRPRRFYGRSDIFDGTVYKRLRRGAGNCEDFLALGACADAIMIDKRQSRSVLPFILSVFNYDPRIRYHAEQNLLLTFLLPPKIHTKSAHKFYGLLEDELNELYFTGVAGGKLKGALVMVRADQKGKEFDLGLRACTSYDGTCWCCEMMAEPGYGDFTQIRVGDYRRFLEHQHPYRTDPSFGEPEVRPAPALRNKLRSARGIEIIQDPEIDLTFYQGYRDPPLFYGVRYFEPFVQSASDLSHNISNFFKGIIKTVQPTDKMIEKWRLEALLSGRFPEIATEVPIFVDRDVAQMFLDLDLESMRLDDLRECTKLLGTSHTGRQVGNP